MAKKFVKLTTGGGGLDINGVIEQYKVNAGANVSAGDFVEFITKWGGGEFSSGTATYVSACKLDNSRVLVAYRDDGNSYYGTAVVLTVSGTTITVGNAVVFNNSTLIYNSAVALTDSKVLVASASPCGKAIVLTVSDTTITAGTEIEFYSKRIECMSAVALTDSKVLIAYKGYDSSSVGKAIVLTVSDTTITAGTAVVFQSGIIPYISAVALTDSKVLIAYRNDSKSNYGTAIVLTVSGTTITVGTAKVFESATILHISAVALSDSKVLVAYQDGGNSSYGTAIVLTVSGTTITAGTAKVFESAKTYYISAVALSDSKVLVAYRDDGNSSYGTAIVLTVSGTTITVGTAKVFESASTTYTSLVAFSETSALVAYNKGQGGFCGLTIDGTTITVQETDDGTNGTFVQPATTRLHNVGVAKTSGAEGDTIEVYCVGE